MIVGVKLREHEFEDVMKSNRKILFMYEDMVISCHDARKSVSDSDPPGRSLSRLMNVKRPQGECLERIPEVFHLQE